ncbi:MAG: AAA family ATPase, partial [Saprospiraceae bacterium]|jgi:superfamily I DNA/RNA helicase|nr:AAA family ATPase [Saprospiraceae bacterium]
MLLTPEQRSIIQSTGNIKINAVAGSGKTTTVIEYAKARPKQSKILYLAFNKSVRIEASKRFADQGIEHVKVETAHSLAYKHIVPQKGYRVKAQGYKTNELVDLLGLQASGEKHAAYIVANHISKFMSYFCNSDKLKVSELNYLDVVSDPKAKIFVTNYYAYIEKQTRMLLGKMDKGELEITHDFYLKKFQLSNPVLNFDYILFDEGQDASAAMLHVFFRQSATKVIVGDTHQQIYGWRYAINSLEKADFKDYYLSTSFRFSQDIADLSMKVLDRKLALGPIKPVTIVGKGKSKTTRTHAALARTNLGLLIHAIQYITENPKIKKIYFEGNINSYTYAEEGASLYDVLNLYNYNHDRIRDPLIRSMKDLTELEDYVDKTGEAQLGMMVEIVKEYENEIYDILRELKEKHVDNDQRDQAEMIFSTVHRCKGLEYDTVHLVNDFLTDDKLTSLITKQKDAAEKENSDEAVIDLARLSEEINLLYVAITRTKTRLYIPEDLKPDDFQDSNHIHWTKGAKKAYKEEKSADNYNTKKAKYKKKSPFDFIPYLEDQPKPAAASAGAIWTTEEDDELTMMFEEGLSLQEMASHFGRTKGAIRARQRRLGLE